jgi:hypothetical protein
MHLLVNTVHSLCIYIFIYLFYDKFQSYSNTRETGNKRNGWSLCTYTTMSSVCRDIEVCNIEYIYHSNSIRELETTVTNLNNIHNAVST